jgi:PIN domain nuclease of toxin-antitoxin system
MNPLRSSRITCEPSAPRRYECRYLDLEASTRVPPRARRELFDSANALVVSVISVWEFILKHRARKLVLSANLGATLDQIVHNPPWALLPVRPEHLQVLAGLPLFHKEPLDRMLVSRWLYSAPTCTISLPAFDPSNNFPSARGAFSRPCTTSTRYFSFPCRNQPINAGNASSARFK